MPRQRPTAPRVGGSSGLPVPPEMLPCTFSRRFRRRRRILGLDPVRRVGVGSVAVAEVVVFAVEGVGIAAVAVAADIAGSEAVAAVDIGRSPKQPESPEEVGVETTQIEPWHVARTMQRSRPCRRHRAAPSFAATCPCNSFRK